MIRKALLSAFIASVLSANAQNNQPTLKGAYGDNFLVGRNLNKIQAFNSIIAIPTE